MTLTGLVSEAVLEACAENLRLDANRIGVHLLGLGSSQDEGGYQQTRPFYPASVVKLFFAVAYEARILRGEVRRSPENERALRDMIRDSSNDATGHLVNVISGANPGPELPLDELEAWMAKRLWANQWFREHGYRGCHVFNRTYNEGAYGVEWQGIQRPEGGRNTLTPEVSARLLADLMGDRVLTPAACAHLREVLQRANPADDPRADAQARNYIGAALPPGAKLWSKAGWTSEVRHDLAAFELPTGDRWVLAIFTECPRAKGGVTAVAHQILRRLPCSG